MKSTMMTSQFGYAVSLNAAGDALAIGAPFDNDGGGVYTVTRSADGVWGLLQRLRPSDVPTVPTAGYGWSVSMADQGSLLVGSPMEAPAGAWW
jgi:hypothetical protein